MQAHEIVSRLRSVHRDLEVFFAVTDPDNIELRDVIQGWSDHVGAVIDSFTV